MRDETDRAFVRDSIDRGLSALKEDPFLAQRILAQANGKEEKIVKKKLSVSFVLVAALLLLLMSAALASGLGLFGELSDTNPDNDARLPKLEKAAEVISSSTVTKDGIVFEIGQAYYEGDRVFVSYRMTGNLASAALHEGKPDHEDIPWDTVLENFICAEQWESDYPEIQKANQWLDGKEQRWVETQVSGIEDGLYLEDGTYLDIINGDRVIRPDGSEIGWKECVIPKNHQAEKLTFKAVMFRSNMIAWQDDTTYRASHTRGEQNEIAFTLARNEHFAALEGSHTNQDYQAAAAFAQGKIDLKGAVTVACPADWITYLKNGDGESPDMIGTWNLYQNGRLVAHDGTQGIRYNRDNSTITYDLLWPCQANLDGLKLTPVYSQSGEHADEVMELKIIGME